MSHIQHTVAGAIARSISHDEIVTVRIGAEEDMQAAYEALIADRQAEDYDHVDAAATLREVWGSDSEGNEWRVHIMQDERTGADRFEEFPVNLEDIPEVPEEQFAAGIVRHGLVTP